MSRWRWVSRGSRSAKCHLLRFYLLFWVLGAVACGRGQADARSGAEVEAAAPEGASAAPAAPAADYGYAHDEDLAAAPPPAPPPPPSEVPTAGGIPAGLSAPGGPTAAAVPGPVVRDPRASDGKAPLLIYSATLTLAVFGTDAALDAVEQLARERRGYLVRRSDASITIRVPAEVFQDTLDGVGKLGDELHRDVNARDVTEEYADIQIRLRNSELVRQRLEALLGKVSKVEEALAVERELERVTQDIEQMKGKLKMLSELVRFSTITANFEPLQVETVARDAPLPFPWLQRLGLPHLLSL